ncbi:MAG: hypothetical protein ACYCX9_06750 [Candidatus Dormibacteria bacterium]
MKVRITTQFDEEKFRRAVEAAAQSGIHQRSAEMQLALDGLADTFQGKPEEVVYAALRAEDERQGWGWPEANLRGFAAGIAEGRRVQIDFQLVRS